MIDVLIKSAQRWHRDEAPLLAAAVSYYLALSLFPVLLILTSALGLFFKWTDSGQDARDYLLQVISDQVAPQLACAIDQSLAHIADYSSLSGPIGVAFLLFAALAIFAEFERAFRRIWSTPKPASLSAWQSVKQIFAGRLRAFALLCGAGLLLVTVFVAGVAFAAVEQRVQLPHAARFWWALKIGLQLAINAMAFTMLYRFLPAARVRWKDALRGGLFTAVVWEVGLLLMGKLLIGDHYTSAYGVIGCFLAVMLWGYYAVSVVFFGAELVQVLGHSSSAEFSPTESMAPGPHAVHAHGTAGSRVVSDLEQQPLKVRRLAASTSRRWGSLLLDFAVVASLIYVASFLGLRQLKSQEMPAGRHSSQRVVQFSENRARHRLALIVYAPLIKSLPGPYHYSTFEGATTDSL